MRWKDSRDIMERLNSPELLDFYIDKNIAYTISIPAYHRSPNKVIKEKFGDCDDLANFGRWILSKAGYDVFGRIVGDENVTCHIGLGVKLDDGSYLLAVNFYGWGNNMSGPHKTILELDQALGYGPGKHNQRGPWDFHW